MADIGNRQYEVQRVIGHRRKGNKLQLLVLWMGVPRSEASWIHVAEVRKRAKEIVSVYFKQQKVRNGRQLLFKIVSRRNSPFSSAPTIPAVATGPLATSPQQAVHAVAPVPAVVGYPRKFRSGRFIPDVPVTVSMPRIVGNNRESRAYQLYTIRNKLTASENRERSLEKVVEKLRENENEKAADEN